MLGCHRALERTGQGRVMPCSGSSPNQTTLEGLARAKYTLTSGQAVLGPKLHRPRPRARSRTSLWTQWDKPIALITYQIQAGTVPCSPESIPSLGQDQSDPSPGSSLPVLCSSSRAELSPGRSFVPGASQQIPPAGSQGSQGHLPSSTAPKFRHLVSPAHLWVSHL